MEVTVPRDMEQYVPILKAGFKAANLKRRLFKIEYLPGPQSSRGLLGMCRSYGLIRIRKYSIFRNPKHKILWHSDGFEEWLLTIAHEIAHYKSHNHDTAHMKATGRIFSAMMAKAGELKCDYLSGLS